MSGVAAITGTIVVLAPAAHLAPRYGGWPSASPLNTIS